MKRFYLFTIFAALLLAASWGCGGGKDEEEDTIEEQDAVGDEVAVETECDNGEDDDGDGDIDCDDDDCIGDPACPTECGDGVLTVDEECEPGEDEDACTADELCNSECECEAFCGNGTYETDLEECEPGEDESECTEDELCNSACECEASCGNGTYESDLEECEPGEDESECTADEYCNSTCECEVFCGNGTFEEDFEDCDEGFEDECGSDEYCNTDTCECLPLCGNGVVDDGEDCDYLADEETCAWDEYCDDSCACGPACGNGVFEPEKEECEPGVDEEAACGEDAACGADCTCVSDYCGNGYVDFYYGEECDMGELNGPDVRCSEDCLVTPICGDNMVDWPETCEDGNTDDDDGCSSDCQFEGEDIPNECGDGIIVPWEDCEPDVEGSCPEGTFCYPEDCYCYHHYCWDGVITGDEECDFDSFGDQVEGSLCGEGEYADLPYCDYETCICIGSHCGDSEIEGDEECDFSEGIMGDCSGDTPACDWDTCQCVAAQCGDGQYTEGAEECDFDWMWWGELGCAEQYCDLETCTCVDSICGDGRIDSDEECDFDQETGEPLEDIPCGSGEFSDLPNCDPFTCLCVGDYCGDGIVNGGEECEFDDDCEGDTPLCDACVCIAEECPEGVVPVDITDDFLGDDGLYRVPGTIPDAESVYDLGRFYCEGSSGPEVIFGFTALVTGTYVFNTLEGGTGVDTVLGLATDCAAGDLVACNDDFYRTRQSQVEHDLMGGDTYYIIVDSYDSSEVGGEFVLTIGQVTEAGDGDPCDHTFNICVGDGLECLAGVCQAPADPVLDDDPVLWSTLEPPPGNYLLNFTGSDANLDVVSLLWTPLDASGDPFVYNESEVGSFRVGLGEGTIEYLPDSGAFEGLVPIELDWLSVYEIALADIASISFYIEDSVGVHTDTITIAESAALGTRDVSASCPVTAFPGHYFTCVEGAYCLADSPQATPFDGTCTSAPGGAPLIMDVHVIDYWAGECRDGDAVLYHIDGYSDLPVGAWSIDGEILEESPWYYRTFELQPPYFWDFSVALCVGVESSMLIGEAVNFTVRDLAGRSSEAYELVH